MTRAERSSFRARALGAPRRVTAQRCLAAACLFAVACAAGCLERRDNDTTDAVTDECVSCHGGSLDPPLSAAPPMNLSGESDRAARGNGAHEVHLSPIAQARNLICTDCHRVPSALDDEGHIDTPYPAEVELGGIAAAFEATPAFDAETGTCKNTFCHGGSFVGGRPSGGTLTEPAWTSTTGKESECGACHGLPPPDPHPQEQVSDCSACHKDVAADGGFVRPDLHVDGVVTFYLGDQ